MLKLPSWIDQNDHRVFMCEDCGLTHVFPHVHRIFLPPWVGYSESLFTEDILLGAASSLPGGDDFAFLCVPVGMSESDLIGGLTPPLVEESRKMIDALDWEVREGTIVFGGELGKEMSEAVSHAPPAEQFEASMRSTLFGGVGCHLSPFRRHVIPSLGLHGLLDAEVDPEPRHKCWLEILPPGESDRGYVGGGPFADRFRVN
jgi:hypothetical protein